MPVITSSRLDRSRPPLPAPLRRIAWTVGYALVALLLGPGRAAAQDPVVGPGARPGVLRDAVRLQAVRAASQGLLERVNASETSRQVASPSPITPSPITLAGGTRVRVRSTALARRVSGRLVTVDDTMLTLTQADQPLAIPLDSIESLEVSTGPRRHWRTGLWIGALGGVGPGMAQPIEPQPCDAYAEHFCSRGEAVAASLAGGALLGAAIGAFVKTERWVALAAPREIRSLISPADSSQVAAAQPPAASSRRPAVSRAPAAAASAALPRGSFDEFLSGARVGEDVQVTDRQGRTTRGAVSAVSSTSIETVAGGTRRTFVESDVLLIEQRRPDSLKNGAAWGAAVVGGSYALGAGVSYDSSDAPLVLRDSLVAAGLGAVIGAGIDASIRRKRVVYSAGRPSVSLTVSPIVARDRRGIGLSVAF